MRHIDIDKDQLVDLYLNQHLGPCPGCRKDWYIDHIVPLCSFDLSNLQQVRDAFKPENHQWLRAEENLAKGASISSSVDDN